ncbi:MAG: hypothetical protein ACJAYE_002312 [Candidatus Azotimanducaceae bacterium]|jgi:hypothetical protein
MSELLLVVAVTAGGLYWLAAMRCKEIAVASARRECNRCEVQLLDQTVHQHHLSLSRDQAGQWRVWRQYRFEYSENGDTRLTGAMTMLGQKITRIALETHNPIIH